MQKTNEQLVVLIKSGIDIADNMLLLWQQNRGFIRKMANIYKGYEEFEDLEQQGYIGLCDAVRGYQPDENVLFIHYAAFWIKQSMIRYIENGGNLVRVPSGARQIHRKYRKLLREFEMQTGRKPSDKEICWSMGIGSKELEELKNIDKMRQIGSLDIHILDDDSTVGDLAAGDMDVESLVLDAMEQEDLKRTLWEMVDALPENQQQVIRSLYQDGKTLQETGETVGVSLERVRTIRQTAFRELRKPSKRHILETFLPETMESMVYHHSGVKRFNRTWTSSTEFAAIKLYEKMIEDTLTSDKLVTVEA